jgi:hypothetical protein
MKITKLPPTPQEVFFQDYQFDPDISEGTDPRKFENSQQRFSTTLKKGRGPKRTDDSRENEPKSARQNRAAKTALKGHPKEKEILKILRGDK